MKLRPKGRGAQTTIRLAIIGCGAIVRAQHVPAICSTGAFELAAVADRSAENAADTVAMWLGIEPDREGATHRLKPEVRDFMASSHWASHTDMLASAECDAVLIATPNNTHERIAADCLDAGMHVFCEKPVAFTVEGHRRLEDLARGHDLVFQVGLVFRYSPVFRHVGGLLENEGLGPPLMMLINEFRPFAFQPWRYSKAVSGGMFIEKNCHHFDLFNWMLGDSVRPRYVTAMGGQSVLKEAPKEVWCLREKKVLPASDVIDHAWVLVEYENGVRAQLGISYFCPWGREFRVSLMGEEWKIDVHEMDRLIYVHRGPEMKEQRFPPDPSGKAWQEEAGFKEEGAVHSGAVKQWEDFAFCVRTGEAPFCDLRKASESIRLAVAADRALLEGRIVEVEFEE